MSDINKRLKVIPEVENSLIVTKEGAAVNDNSCEAEFIAAHTLFLGQFAHKLTSQFGVDELKSVTVHGTEHHMFLFESKQHYLSISAKGGGNIQTLDAEIRQVLAQK